jgi:hypothetical protein
MGLSPTARVSSATCRRADADDASAVDVPDQHPGTKRFYRRHGFAVAETTDGSRNEERAPDIRFVWSAP